MKEVSWKHIRNSVAITILVWPFAAIIVSPVLGLLTFLLTLPFPDLSFKGLLTTCFCLSVGIAAYMLGNLLSPKRAILHGILSVVTALPTAVLSVFLIFSAVNFYMSPPSDWRLIRRFERNEALFYELRDVAQAENELTSHYATMKRLGISSVSRRKNPAGVYFALDKHGFDTYKYYVYRQIPPPSRQIVEKIGADDVGYRSIRDGWYLYAEAISD